MKPKILIIIHGIGVGGAEKQIYEYIKRAAGVADVQLLYFLEQERSPDLKSLYRQIGITPILIDRSAHNLVGFLMRLMREIRVLRPDIVCTVMAASAGTWGRLAAWLAGVRHIVHSDRSLNPPVSMGHRILRPLVDRITARFLPCSMAIAEWLKSEGIPAERIRVIVNGVDLSKFSPRSDISIRPVWGIAEGATVLGFLGKFRPEKRVDLLLDSLVAMPETDRPDWVVIGGDGPLAPFVQERVQGNPWLRQHTVLPGLISDVPGFMAAIDYLVLSSDFEGMPNVILEAMAMGKPIVATRVSDVPSMIDGVGFLAAPGDRNSLMHALQAMQRLTWEERRALGASARARVLDNFVVEQTAKSFWQAQIEVLS